MIVKSIWVLAQLFCLLNSPTDIRQILGDII